MCVIPPVVTRPASLAWCVLAMQTLGTPSPGPPRQNLPFSAVPVGLLRTWEGTRAGGCSTLFLFCTCLISVVTVFRSWLSLGDGDLRTSSCSPLISDGWKREASHQPGMRGVGAGGAVFDVLTFGDVCVYRLFG